MSHPGMLTLAEGTLLVYVSVPFWRVTWSLFFLQVFHGAHVVCIAAADSYAYARQVTNRAKIVN